MLYQGEIVQSPWLLRAAIKFYWKGALGDANANSALTSLRDGNRVSRAGMRMDREHGGKSMTRPSDIFTAIHGAGFSQFTEPSGHVL